MYFIDLRASSSGGIPAEQASVWEDGSRSIGPQDFATQLSGKNVVLATHGFNVNRNNGLHSLSCWSNKCQLPSTFIMVGVLWPGDSAYFPVMDYPAEGMEAIKSGRVLASFLNQYLTQVQTLSLVSHSLGARVILQTLAELNFNIDRLILMAGAIEDDCLVNEYADAAKKARQIYVIASNKDWVLEFAFPIGNPIGEIIMHDHPYFTRAIGRSGPSSFDSNICLWQIPEEWNYGHLEYLPSDQTGPHFTLPMSCPSDSETQPSQADNWKPSWSAGAVATQVDS